MIAHPDLVAEINLGRDPKTARAIRARLDRARIKNLCAALRVREVNSPHATLDLCDARAQICTRGSIHERLHEHVLARSFQP